MLKTIPITIIATVFLLLTSIENISAISGATASIKDIQGNVDVKREGNILTGRKGLILHDNDLVLTDKRSKVTIIFRDGSIIRLFSNTKFLIEKSVEVKKGSRKFFHKFILRVGSFWGKFTKNTQNTVIKTPTATCGIKGTSVSLSQIDNQLSVSLYSGRISIKNDDEEIILKPGQQVKGVRRLGQISDKVQNLPYRIIVTPDNNQIEIPQSGEENQVFFTIQLIDIATNKNVSRSGLIYMNLEHDKIIFDKNISLNYRGYTRTKARIQHFKKDDYKSGTIEIHALLDGSKNMDIEVGRTVLTYHKAGKSIKKIKINASSGQIN